jgi:Domain of unknown function (DUF397)
VDRSPTWRKSRRSGSGNACVEIRNDLSAIRDSKNPEGPVLPVRELRGLIATVKAGS